VAADGSEQEFQTNDRELYRAGFPQAAEKLLRRSYLPRDWSGAMSNSGAGWLRVDERLPAKELFCVTG